ncbi:hypothetical protein [Rickettsia endosymbiont of Gonocerus acuteangulatus]
MSKRIKLQAIPINRTDYCQFLIVSQKNYSKTYAMFDIMPMN